MTKEELMKYANDPFWVKLRWVLFIFFWGLWIAMLAGAIAIIVYAPKCAAPTPLVWWKKGPLVNIRGDENDVQIQELKDFHAQGVVYEVPAENTYSTERMEDIIKNLVDKYK
jgi:solute carrier family 3 protein 2